MADPMVGGEAARVWPVGALCLAIANALDARFNPVRVGGEITGFTRAASGHCYFSLRDDGGQLRCAMFRRAASQLDFSPRDGDRVELRGALGVYEARGELQLIVESMRKSGQGTLFEQFLARKAALEKEGLFDPARKRALPVFPRGIGVVTSLGAAALHDVITALQRRVPHVSVLVAPASVQGESAPVEIVRALQSLFALASPGPSVPSGSTVHIDVILMVRGGGALEDLWAFNDETLARTMARSPVPIVSGVGHETDFTIADFVADLRAPTPTAAAELVATAASQWLEQFEGLQARLQNTCLRGLDKQCQRLDLLVSRLGRPSHFVIRRKLALQNHAPRLATAVQSGLRAHHHAGATSAAGLFNATHGALRDMGRRLDRLAWRLAGLDPTAVLQRGYALLTDVQGTAITSALQVRPGQSLSATLADGVVDLRVVDTPLN